MALIASVLLAASTALVRIQSTPWHVHGARPHTTLLVATDENGRQCGSCGLEAAIVSDEGVVRRPALNEKVVEDLRPLLSSLIVAPVMRGRGVGKQLVAAAAEQAVEWNYDEIVLNVQSGNRAAVQLYRACGFEQAGATPKENFMSRLSGGPMLFLRKPVGVSATSTALRAAAPTLRLSVSPSAGSAWLPRMGARSRAGVAVMKLPQSVSDAVSWGDSTYPEVEVEALWAAVVECYGDEELALKGVSQVRGQVICPIFASPTLIRESYEALVSNIGEEEAKTIMIKNPCVLTCGAGIATADPDEIRRLANVREVLDAIPPQALLGVSILFFTVVFAKIIAIKLGYSDPVFFSS